MDRKWVDNNEAISKHLDTCYMPVITITRAVLHLRGRKAQTCLYAPATNSNVCRVRVGAIISYPYEFVPFNFFPILQRSFYCTGIARVFLDWKNI